MVYSHSLQFETNPRPTKVFIILISKRWPNGSLHYKHIQAFVLSSSSIIYKLIKTNHSYNPQQLPKPPCYTLRCLRNGTTLRFDFFYSFMVCAQTYAFLVQG